MSKDLTQVVREYKEWKQIENEANDRIKELKAIITSEMDARGVDKMNIDVFTVKNTTVTTNYLNEAALKKDHEQLYRDYLKPSSHKRFSVT